MKLKMIIMFLVTTVAGLFMTGGLPSTGTAWTVFAITVAGSMITYIAKNAVFPSISLFGNLDLRDILSGVIMGIGTGLSNFLAVLAAGAVFSWSDMFKAVGVVVLGYLIKTFAQTPATP